MALSPLEKTQVGVGCVALAWMAGCAIAGITIVVLVIKALLKYNGS